MRLTQPTRLVVEVDPSKFVHAPQSRESLHYLLERLFSGEEVDETELSSWGLTVRQVKRGQRDFITIPRIT